MKNRYLSALQDQCNLLGLGSVVALAAAATSLTPLLVGVVVEAAYLIFVPNSKWFESRLSRQHDAEVRAQREQLKNEILPKLRPTLQKRFSKLEEAHAAIDLQVVNDRLWMQEVLRKLDFLLDKFLQFALKDEQFRAYLYEARVEKLGENQTHAPELNDRWVRETVDLLQRNYDGDIHVLENQFESERDEDTRAILAKRLEVTKRRRDFVARIGNLTVNLSQQLQLLEDTFGLISDELLARPPEQVLGDIEEVVSQTKIMTDILEDMAPYERMLEAL